MFIKNASVSSSCTERSVGVSPIWPTCIKTPYPPWSILTLPATHTNQPLPGLIQPHPSICFSPQPQSSFMPKLVDQNYLHILALLSSCSPPHPDPVFLLLSVPFPSLLLLFSSLFLNLLIDIVLNSSLEHE